MHSIEVCAGAGGQAFGLEQAGFEHQDLVEIDAWACQTLRMNRPSWRVTEGDLKDFSASKYRGIDLYAGGLPCPPFSVAGKQLGEADERNLFSVALEQIAECKPKAVMIENVKGLLAPEFKNYRALIEKKLRKQGFSYVDWQLFNASQFGVCQHRPRLILVALRGNAANRFDWPKHFVAAPTVGELLFDLMSEKGWKGAAAWKKKANTVAPTIVGGSKKHGGPDLGPTRARAAWAQLGVDGIGIANEAPEADFPLDASPKLTVRMVARIQGFSDNWKFAGKKTNSYRQVGNAFPPPVANAVSSAIAIALGNETQSERTYLRRSAA
jgi:DNA (cytosine-5)-methyltransferase 1